jgi:DNA-binding transcriptional regulator GbsR (MarR family)
MDSIPSKSRMDMIATVGRWFRRVGLPRSTGQIYGLLFFSATPLSLDDMVKSLSVSKASASMGARQLVNWGAVRQTWVRGDRRDYFEVVEDLGGLLSGIYKNILKPKLGASRRPLEQMLAGLEAEQAKGTISIEERQVCEERVRSLCRLQQKLQNALPVVEELLS